MGEKIGETMVGGMCMKVKKEQVREIISTDPFGSYTGTPVDVNERPVQDADDL